MNEDSSKAKIPPGDFGIPIVRQNLRFASDPSAFGIKMSDKYGPIFKTHILGNPAIFLEGKNYLDHVLDNEGKLFESTFPPTFEKLLGNSISTQLGDKHTKSRRILAEIFRNKEVKNFSPKVHPKSLYQIDKWEKSENFNLYNDIRAFCFDLACNYLLGIENLSASDLFEDYCKFEAGLFSIPISIPFSKFSKAYRARKDIHEFINKLIEQNKYNNKSLIYFLLNSGLEIKEIKDQILVLIFAGHGTLASAIWSLIYNLAKNPEIKAKSLEILKNEDSSYCEKYFHAIALETLRISTPVVGLFRKVLKTHVFNNYIFPENWTISLQIRETHLSEKYYSHPHTFDPTRYLSKMPREKNFAFGGGPRECIGKMLALEEIKQFAMALIGNYDWDFEDISKVKIKRLPVTSPKDNYKIIFSKL